MEFVIAAIATVVAASLVKKRKPSKPKSSASREADLRKADEELITVIMPTIDNDK